MKPRRRDILRAALALAGGAFLESFQALAAPEKGRVKITAIKAMQLQKHGNALVKVETDAGLVGYGEAGASGPMARARIDTFKHLLLGQDPLAIERHFHKMTTQMHTYMAHIPTISGIDIALWDLAGKITGLPVYALMGGPFRDKIRLYINTAPKDMLDPASCREWAAEMKQSPQGWSTFKVDVMRAIGGTSAQVTPMLTSAELVRVEKGYANVRQAIGPEMDLIVHCHNEFDLPSAIGIARAVEPIRPLWLEDALPVAYSDSWLALKRAARVPILTGEKLELPKQFLPFLQNEAVDVIHPDLAFTGGLTGGRKIADLAALYHVPVATHNVGTLVLTMASAHFGASIFDFVTSENVIGQGRLVEEMAAGRPPVVEGSYLEVPQVPGLGADLNPEVLRANLEPGEPFWG
ncbi:MAG: mandelate racemase/muconate lactonizing enzyme family protein [Acidobacteria bacterium]|nr:mandelate racemase/muconate lactonizing enzyme family protein [Acidobacteriota bacterium]